MRVCVDGVERLHERGDGLHGQGDHKRLARGHAALKAAGVVAVAPVAAALVPNDAIVHFAAGKSRALKAQAKLNALDGGDGKARSAKLAGKARRAAVVAAQTAHQALCHDNALAAQRLSRSLSCIDRVLHLLRSLSTGTTALARLDRIALKGALIDKRHTADALDVGVDLDTHLAQECLGDSACCYSRCCLAGAAAL